MASGGQIRETNGETPAHRNWTRVLASWFVVFFIVATWSIFFRAVSPLLFGSARRTEVFFSMSGSTPGNLCIVPLGRGLAEAVAEGRECDVMITASPS